MHTSSIKFQRSASASVPKNAGTVVLLELTRSPYFSNGLSSDEGEWFFHSKSSNILRNIQWNSQNTAIYSVLFDLNQSQLGCVQHIWYIPWVKWCFSNHWPVDDGFQWFSPAVCLSSQCFHGPSCSIYHWHGKNRLQQITRCIIYGYGTPNWLWENG